MGKRRLWHYSKFLLLTVVIVANGGVNTVSAITSNSSHYQVTETEFGSGAVQNSCSGQYCAKASIGDMTTGSSKSSVSTARFGSVTEGIPLLDVIVDSGVSNLGVLGAERTATKTTTVRVRTYLSSGYTLQIVGNPPKYGNHSLSTSSTPTDSTLGTEQFGINAAANTSPSVGAGPVQVPSAQTSFGVVNDDYGIPNKFKFASGDILAHSDSESGQTDYTISMIVNVSNQTPAGHYSGDFSAIVVPVY
jgi:hypothetical protein